eukprot:1641843-Pleurochrysis_carterae.AAC.1
MDNMEFQVQCTLRFVNGDGPGQLERNLGVPQHACTISHDCLNTHWLRMYTQTPLVGSTSTPKRHCSTDA